MGLLSKAALPSLQISQPRRGMQKEMGVGGRERERDYVNTVWAGDVQLADLSPPFPPRRNSYSIFAAALGETVSPPPSPGLTLQLEEMVAGVGVCVCVCVVRGGGGGGKVLLCHLCAVEVYVCGGGALRPVVEVTPGCPLRIELSCGAWAGVH